MPATRAIEVGDVIEIVRSGHAGGGLNAAGLVLEVIGEPGDETYRVRWVDGRETFYRPGSDVRVRERPDRAS
jgi:hypothetical protein